MDTESDHINVNQNDVQRLANKLDELRDQLTEEETTVLVGILSLAGKSLDGSKNDARGGGSGDTASPPSTTNALQSVPKKRLKLERETLRWLNVWDRLLQVEAHSLWTCNGAPIRPGEEVINPKGK